VTIHLLHLSDKHQEVNSVMLNGRYTHLLQGISLDVYQEMQLMTWLKSSSKQVVKNLRPKDSNLSLKGS